MEKELARNLLAPFVKNKEESDRINNCLVGTLLGDAHLQFSPSTSFQDKGMDKIPREGTTRYRFGQKYHQRAYVEYVYSLVTPLCSSMKKPHPEVGSDF